MLNGWKAIAAYLGREERTAMRWAAERGMPVHRIPGPGRGSVFALAEELDAWRSADRKAAPEAPEDVADAQPLEAAPALVAEAPSASAERRHSRRRWAIVAAIAGATAVLIVAVVLWHQRPLRANAAEPVATDPAAKALFLQASYDWNLRTHQSLSRAVDEYSQAIGHDPRMAPAYVGLANTYLLLREDGAVPEAEAYDRAEAAAKAALAIAPDTAEMHRLLGFIAFWWHGDRETAGRELRHAIELAPNDPLTHLWLANMLSANGEPQDALREAMAARDLDPASSSILSGVGSLDYLAGRRDEGLAILRRIEREQPGSVGVHRALADFALFDGHADEYVREAAETARERGETGALHDVEKVAAAAPGGTPAIIAALIRQRLSAAPNTSNGYFLLAQAYALAGQGTRALAALAQSCGRREIASFAAPGDLWLSRGVSRAQITDACGPAAAL